jgi:hypothetical protein
LLRNDNIRIEEREDEEARQVVLLVSLGRADRRNEEPLARGRGGEGRPRG